jgi:hypothetical protein
MSKLTKIAIFCLFLTTFSGCQLAGSQSRSNQNNTVNQSLPGVVPGTRNEPVPPDVVTPLKSEILQSANNTQNQLSGLLNASVSKLSEKLTGVEANLSELVKVTANTNISSNLELKNQISAAVTAVADLKVEIKATATFTNEMTAHIARLEAIMTNNVNGQAGVYNKLDSMQQEFKSAAGRDIQNNYLPKEAVKIIESSNWMLLGIISTFCGLGLSVLTIAYRNARHRENLNSKLLMACLASMEPEKAEAIQKSISL